MNHPVLKTLLARLRAFESVERASFALATIDAMMEPFERHRVRFDARDGNRILAMGMCVASLYEHIPQEAGLEGLFRPADRAFLNKLIESLLLQEMACHFAATAFTAAQLPVALEGMILPEPPVTPYGGADFLSLCLIRSDFPSEIGDPVRLQPMTLGPTRFITLENRGPDRARLCKARWPRPDAWQIGPHA